MGEPVQIIDMARDLIRLSGRDVESVPIRFTGLRPGEKLHERLFYETENVALTDVDKIFRVVDARAPEDIEERARRLLALAYGDRDDELRAALFNSVASRAPTGQAATVSADAIDLPPITVMAAEDPTSAVANAR